MNLTACRQSTHTRLNERYWGALELAKLILQASSIELRHGQHQASSFLVDMNQVFEDFVVIALRESLGLNERQFPQNARGRRICLDVASRVVLEPDLSWWQANRCCFVGDVKYKRVNAPGIKHPDLYQLLAYTVATDLPNGLLVYAAGEGEP
ncbi:MAG: 5-methylcytosine restriction system specificity protein McrC [Pirellulaceae bacterium]